MTENTEDAREIAPIANDIIQKLVLDGDLRGLTPAQKVDYYRGFCERLGLDPATQPFKLLKLSGKETLYADRSCAAQLNRKHNIGHSILAREIVSDCYVVTARAQQGNGRFTESIGAVPIKGLQGEALCNAMMKAETKAKRRSTLDICGLGMIDEVEIGEWANGGVTSTIEGKEAKPVNLKAKQLAPALTKQATFQEIKQAMQAAPAAEHRSENNLIWKDVICTYGKAEGKIRGETLGHISHFAPEVMQSLYERFVDPQTLVTLKPSDEPLRQGLIEWKAWAMEQEQKRNQFDQRRAEVATDSWDESDEIPIS